MLDVGVLEVGEPSAEAAAELGNALVVPKPEDEGSWGLAPISGNKVRARHTRVHMHGTVVPMHARMHKSAHVACPASHIDFAAGVDAACRWHDDLRSSAVAA
jgi:hypothetical protein